MNVGKSSGIMKVAARQILDSRGRPTVEADVFLNSGAFGRAAAPSGASTGRHEAHELRDGDPAYHDGMGVLRAVSNVNHEIAGLLIGMDALAQSATDQTLIELDGTSSLSRLGANGVLAVSMAVARAAAAHQSLPLYAYISELANGAAMSLPMPMTNILSGGAHARRGMDVQDFLVVPVGAQTYSQALDVISKVRAAATRLMIDDGLSVLLADEGGLSPSFARAEQALMFMVRAFEAAGCKPGQDVAIALDIAASELLVDDRYELAGEARRLTTREMANFVVELVRNYPVISVEDPLDQDDWRGWQGVTRALPDIQIVGDDLFATNPERIQRGSREGAANAALIKVNQNGTVTGTLAAMAAARTAGYKTVVSARSGETEDTFIADLAVGTGAGQIKIGSVRSSERLAKYNQLLRIEEASGLPFAGMSGFAGLSSDVAA